MRLENFILPLLLPFAAAQAVSTFRNPILPGWHSDPSCVRVEDTYYCVTSTFIAFPGLPVFASKDLIQWRLVSHAWNRDVQIAGVSWDTFGQQDGMWAATIREHNGEFFVICEYSGTEDGDMGVLFRTSDVFDDASWSDAVTFWPEGIDPDLFWDDDGKVWMATHGIRLQEIDLETGELSQPPLVIWEGTGGVWPEGPHFYKRDGYYYLFIAEGGTEQDHSITIARATNITGPYEPYENNPLLTARGTDNFFQGVGHGDLFTDVDGNWWGIVHAKRTGPDYYHYPMGRESVLFNVTWEEGEWPVLETVESEMRSWPLPQESRDIPGDGAWVADADQYTFDADMALPNHFIHWRVPRQGAFQATETGLQITPHRNNLTGEPEHETDDVLAGRRGLGFIGRRQEHTLFNFTVEVSFEPTEIDHEAGISVFLTQWAHIDVGLLWHQSEDDDEPSLHLRFRASGRATPPPTQIVPVPQEWLGSPIELNINGEDREWYSFRARGGENKDDVIEFGRANARLVSGWSGSYLGVLLGAYATCNGQGTGEECPDGGVPSFQNWRYEPVGQYVSVEDWVPA